MLNIIWKEMKLSASPISFLFIPFGFMFFLPGYPVLCGAFFVTLGIFQSFQYAREANDIVFSALLPIAKRSVVLGKYLFVCCVEIISTVPMIIAVLLRMTVLLDSTVYRSNALMNANLFALGMALLIFGLFNLIFVGGFFKTAYKFTRPFILYVIASFIAIGFGEALHHVPGLESVNAFGTAHFTLQLILLVAGVLAFLLLTLCAYRKSCQRFEKIDL